MTDLTDEQKAEQRHKIAEVFRTDKKQFDDKNKARLMRELADKEDEVASLCASLGWHGLEGLHHSDAEFHRLLADRSDPPAVWKKGDFATDKDGNLWQCSGDDVWLRFGIREPYSTEALTDYFGPLRKVYVSDPSENQVVVSVDGFDQDYVAEWLVWTGQDPEEEICIRVAEAVRDQQVGTETNGDGA